MNVSGKKNKKQKKKQNNTNNKVPSFYQIGSVHVCLAMVKIASL